MKGIGNWLRRFMMGRYGTDKLNSLFLWIAVALILLSIFLPVGWPNMVVVLLSYVLMGVVIFRSLSRNTYQRHKENRWYLNLLERLKDREHRYFTCPKCKQPVRVPKGKGKIAISCPKCREKFIKKT
jgi:hypothetical protein